MNEENMQEDIQLRPIFNKEESIEDLHMQKLDAQPIPTAQIKIELNI